MTTKFPILNFIKQPKPLTPLLVVGVGGYQTLKNYKAAEKEDKTKGIVRDLSILSASIAGILMFQKATSKIFNIKIFSNLLTKATNLVKKIKAPTFLEKAKPIVSKAGTFTKNRIVDARDILKSTVEEFNGCLGGIIGGLTAASVVENLGFTPKKIKNKDRQANDSPNYNLRSNPDNAVESFAKVAKTIGAKTLQAVDLPIASVDSYAVTQEKGIENKFKKASYELIANNLLPALFLSTTVKATQNLNKYAKLGLRGLSLMLGLFLGHHAAVYFDKEVTQEIKEDIMKETKGKPLTLKDIRAKVLSD
jgi:hypothetical protein